MCASLRLPPCCSCYRGLCEWTCGGSPSWAAAWCAAHQQRSRQQPWQDQQQQRQLAGGKPTSAPAAAATTRCRHNAAARPPTCPALYLSRRHPELDLPVLHGAAVPPVDCLDQRLHPDGAVRGCAGGGGVWGAQGVAGCGFVCLTLASYPPATAPLPLPPSFTDFFYYYALCFKANKRLQLPA